MDRHLAIKDLADTVDANLRSVRWRNLASFPVLGFALNRAWVYLMFLGTAVSFVSWDGTPVPAASYIISTSSLTAVLFWAALWRGGSSFRRLAPLLATRIGAPTLVAIGTVAMAFSSTPGWVGTLLGIVGGVTTGIGSGFIDLGYGEHYRNVSSHQTCLEVPLAFCVAAAVFFITVGLPAQVRSVVVTLLPLASGLILFGPLKVWSPRSLPTVQPVPISVQRFAVRVGACACLVGVADGTVRAVFMTTSGVSPEAFYRGPLLWASIISLVVIWGCMLCTRSFNLRSVYKIAVIIMALFFQLLPVFVGLYAQNVLALAGYGTFNALIWIVLADTAYTYRLSSVTVFGVGWGMVTVGVLLGSLVGDALCEIGSPFSPRMLSLVVLVATLAVLLSYMFVLKESDLVELTSLGEQEQRAIEEGAAPQSGRAETSRAPRFVNRCKEVAQAFGLTERETEIVILYAKGRSYARLQEELHCSRGTVTTHLRHIYQKMDIHSKQELLDMIENWSDDE